MWEGGAERRRQSAAKAGLKSIVIDALPEPAQALWVRMVMRKGELFRDDRLDYAEIGTLDPAVAPLMALGWLECDPVLPVSEVLGMLTKAEVGRHLGACLKAHGLKRGDRKTDMILSGGANVFPAEVEAAIDAVIAGIDQAQSKLTGVRSPDPDKQAAAAATIQTYGEARGRGLWYPLMGSGPSLHQKKT